jgi:hypothetical protein
VQTAPCLDRAKRQRSRKPAEVQGGKNVSVVASEDEPELDVSFVVAAVDDDEARRRGHALLDAVEADEFVWEVGVMQSFSP